jgi:hypothetical protein
MRNYIVPNHTRLLITCTDFRFLLKRLDAADFAATFGAIVTGLLHLTNAQWQPAQRPENDDAGHDTKCGSAIGLGTRAGRNVFLVASRAVGQRHWFAAVNEYILVAIDHVRWFRMFQTFCIYSRLWWLRYCGSVD